ncbi:hypothetical protein HYH03_007194 [Edaphochlamys debaryana]|uniref:Uncharacterized protein n=1 Tax=Edaphochlamys debaryana TaxID=47281 RepID=A0A835Y4P8_9CHLO|nr:hypothetical protein HYH03_007194 [Edaphochlamys debaryana]|eukprot:KAG2494678.1 hypothetical protein HYH03_007194 [Edaphochlamys debaryana]
MMSSNAAPHQQHFPLHDLLAFNLAADAGQALFTAIKSGPNGIADLANARLASKAHRGLIDAHNDSVRLQPARLSDELCNGGAWLARWPKLRKVVMDTSGAEIIQAKPFASAPDATCQRIRALTLVRSGRDPPLCAFLVKLLGSLPALSSLELAQAGPQTPRQLEQATAALASLPALSSLKLSCISWLPCVTPSSQLTRLELNPCSAVGHITQEVVASALASLPTLSSLRLGCSRWLPCLSGCSQLALLEVVAGGDALPPFTSTVLPALTHLQKLQMPGVRHTAEQFQARLSTLPVSVRLLQTEFTPHSSEGFRWTGTFAGGILETVELSPSWGGCIRCRGLWPFIDGALVHCGKLGPHRPRLVLKPSVLCVDGAHAELFSRCELVDVKLDNLLVSCGADNEELEVIQRLGMPRALTLTGACPGIVSVQLCRPGSPASEPLGAGRGGACAGGASDPPALPLPPLRLGDLTAIDLVQQLLQRMASRPAATKWEARALLLRGPALHRILTSPPDAVKAFLRSITRSASHDPHYFLPSNFISWYVPMPSSGALYVHCPSADAVEAVAGELRRWLEAATGAGAGTQMREGCSGGSVDGSGAEGRSAPSFEALPVTLNYDRALHAVG